VRRKILFIGRGELRNYENIKIEKISKTKSIKKWNKIKFQRNGGDRSLEQWNDGLKVYKCCFEVF
jgi:hypothetical protein